MAIVEIKIDAIESFADGQAFSEAGSYLRIKGIAKGEIDPAAPENSVIVDLDKAPRNVHGMIAYEADFFILRPAKPRRASGVLVYDVTNRGRKMICPRCSIPPPTGSKPWTLPASKGRGRGAVGQATES